MTNQTPHALGYRLPAEWEPHAATWLSWPRRDGFSFPGRYDAVLPTFGEMVRVIAAHETVHVNVADAAMEEEARQHVRTAVQFHCIPTDEPWCRDHGPIFVTRPGAAAIVDWQFNAWGRKYPRFDRDDAVPEHIARLLNLPLFQPPMILEGGSIDGNGAGTLLTTEACLLNPNRNPHLTRPQIEQYVFDYLGVTDIHWLGDGIVGDDTDGHVDDLARFVNPTTVVAAVEADPLDVNYAALRDNLQRLRAMKDQKGQPLRVVELPMPGVVEQAGRRLPASYANFYIANGLVLLPTFRHANDARAAAILQELFPTRRVIGLDSTELIWGRGSFHCLTQQQPLV